jgi:hypothetical protein
MVDSPFRIDILDAAGDKIASGPLKNILQLNTFKALDKIGSASFVIPANDPKTRFIAPGCKFDIFDEVDGYLGRYIYREASYSEIDGRGMMTVNTWDALKELTRQIVGFRRNYEAENVEDIIADLLSDVSGWTLDSGTGLGVANVTYQGQTVYQAIEELAKRWGYHFRLGASAQELEFGAFGTLIPELRLVNISGQNSSFDDAEEIGVLKGIRQSISDEELYNLIVAVGAGTGKSQLRLEDGETGASYTVDSRTRANGDEETFIEDTVSQAAYGTRELVLIFDQIRPIANTATSKEQARTELLYNSEIFLERYKDPRIQFDNVQVYALKKAISAGDKVFIRYKALDDDSQLYIDIEGEYWVTQHSRTRNAEGQRLSTLQIVNTDRAEKSDTDLLADTVRGIKSEKLWIKPTAFRFSDTYTDTVQNSNGDYQDKTALFTFTIDETVTEVTRVFIEWRTKPLYTSAIWSALSPVTTLGSAPTNPHSHAIDLTNVGTDGVFTVVTSDNYPTDVSLELNGVNIDNHADVDYIDGGSGPWNNGGSPNAALFVRMDITDLIVNAAGGIYQTFTLEIILNAARTRDCAVPFWSLNDPNNQSYGNQGIVEMKIITQGVAQAIP